MLRPGTVETLNHDGTLLCWFFVMLIKCTVITIASTNVIMV